MFFVILMFHKTVHVYKRKYQTPNINKKVMFYNKLKKLKKILLYLSCILIVNNVLLHEKLISVQLA